MTALSLSGWRAVTRQPGVTQWRQSPVKRWGPVIALIVVGSRVGGGIARAEGQTPSAAPSSPTLAAAEIAPVASAAPMPSGTASVLPQSYARIARMNRPVNLVFVNAAADVWLKTLSDSAGVRLYLDPTIALNSLSPLSVVASRAPFYPLLLQIARAEGLGLIPSGDGYILRQLSPQDRLSLPDFPHVVNAYGQGLGYMVAPGQSRSTTPGANHRVGQPAPLSEDASPPISAGQSADRVESGTTMRNTAPYALPATAPAAPNGGNNAIPGGGGSGISLGSAGALGASFGGSSVENSPVSSPPVLVVQQAAPSLSDASGNVPFDIGGAPGNSYQLQHNAGMAAGGPVGLNMPAANALGIQASALLQYVLQYAASPRLVLQPPEVVYPELTTSTGSLQYLAAVAEAFTHVAPSQRGMAASRAAVYRLQRLLTRAEELHRRSCHQEELQTEILILRGRLRRAGSDIRPLLSNILQHRQSELDAMGR